MSARLRHRLRAQHGSALITTMLVLSIVLAVAGTVFAEAMTLNKGVRRATGSQRAFQAAQAGLDQALGRINVLKGKNLLPANECVVTDHVPPVNTTGPDGGWCASTAPESLGNGQSFTYRTSISPLSPDTCAGDDGSGGRCIVAFGTADGVTARVRARVVQQSTTTPFCNRSAVTGYSEVKLKRASKLTSDPPPSPLPACMPSPAPPPTVRTNKKLTVEPNVSLAGYTVEAGPKAKIDRRYTGPVSRKTTNFYPALPDFWMTDPATNTRKNTAVWNDNPTATNPYVGNPKITYSGPITRELNVGDKQQITLPAGVYNFCKLTLGKDAKITIAQVNSANTPPKDAVRIFIDSKYRAGSQCRDRGTLDAKTGASFINDNKDKPLSLQIFAFSKRSRLKVANKSPFAAMIYAPMSKVTFNGTGKFTGGVVADKVEVNKNMEAKFSNDLTSWTTNALKASQVVAWNQCQSTNSSANPQAGC